MRLCVPEREEWLLENDVGYTIYLQNKVEEEEKAGTFKPEGHSKDSLLSFIRYAGGFKEIEDLRQYLSSRQPAPSVSSEERFSMEQGRTEGGAPEPSRDSLQESSQPISSGLQAPKVMMSLIQTTFQAYCLTRL
ncbi:hypothetical protein COCON_G00092060 [Conger conger]|uniref:Uncharacterized protein n=1 Tax=Conger conger TaxID=82655 RepID=A0A9Q1I087_CONCO|nr:hypothetical protein COCON_G00092060 [Conger conger]